MFEMRHHVLVGSHCESALKRFAKLLFVLLGATSTSCAPRYARHVHRSLPVEARRTCGCVDLGFFASRDAAFPSASMYLEVHIQNRCDEAALVDLGALRMTAYRVDGTHRELAFYDPRGEVAPLHAEVGGVGVERFRIDDAGSPEELAYVCLDPANVVPNAPPKSALPVCLPLSSDASRVAP